MNNLHNQGHSGHGQEGNLYAFANSQDDFSTPFTNDGAPQQPTFTDSSSFLNSDFNSHFDQQMNTDPHDNMSSDFFPQNTQPLWSQSQFFDQPQLGSYQGMGEAGSGQPFSNPYNSHLSAYNELHENSTFSNFPTQPAFASRVSPSARQENAMNTINPHAIQTPAEYVFQQPGPSHVNENVTPATALHKPATSTQPSLSHSQQQQQLPMQHQPPSQQLMPQATGPQRRFLDTDLVQAIDIALPRSEKQSWFSIRPRSQFKSPAEVQSLTKFPFINISKEAFDSAEARVIPPPRRIFWSVNELEQKLQSLPPGVRDPKIKSMLESKVSKARTRTKPSKGHKQRKLVSALGPVAAGSTKPVTTIVEDVSDDESSSETSDDESEYVSDSDEVIEEEPSPLPSSRPDDPTKAREYDILKAVWARSAVRIGPDDVKRRMAAFLEIVKKIRIEWRAASSPETVAAKRKEFEQILRLTVKHGHHNFIESIDQLTPLASIIAAGLLELIKGNLYSDGLLEAILELVVKIPNIDAEFLKTTKLDRHKERFLKKTQGRIKDLASFIEIPEATTSAPKQGESVDPKPIPTSGAPAMARTGSAQSVGPKKSSEQTQTAIKKPPTSTIDSKKVANSLTAVKKTPAIAAGKAATAVANTLKPSAAPKAATAKPGDKSAAVSNGTISKPAIRQVAPPKAPSVFSSLTAAKKPATVTTTAAKPVATKSKTPEPKPSAAPPPPKKPAFSFSDMLANVNKPKEEPKKAESKEQRPPETEEERRKRLRKEERRKLRVTWKPDHELEAVRIFDHRQDDETMHDAMDVADAADLKSEGQAFKRQLRRDNVSSVEPEDEEEQEYIDWHDPKLTDFSSIYERSPGDMDPPPQNVETRAGGSTKFTSTESEVQQQREQGVMIEVYQSIRDVPPHPKEPADPFNGKALAQYDFGAIESCGTNPPVPARLADRNQQLLRQYGHQSHSAPQVGPPASGDISSILAMLGQGQSTPQVPYQPQQQQYSAPQPTDPIAALLAQFNGTQPQPQPQAQAPQPSHNPYQDAINLFNSMQGVGQAPAASTQPPQQQAPTNTDLTSILASLAAGSGQQQTPAPAAPAPPPPQPQAQADIMSSGIDPSLVGWLAQYNASNNGAAQSQQQSGPQGNWSNYGNSVGGQAASATDWLQQLNGMNSHSNGAQSNHNDRKRGYEDDLRNDGGGGKKKQKKIPFTGVPFLVCRYYKEGRCQKGSECTFLHE